MKKVIMLSLSLLIVANSVQTVLGIPTDNQISQATWTGAKNGFFTGLFSGLTFGGIIFPKPIYSNDAFIRFSLGFVTGHCSASAASTGKADFNQKLKETIPQLEKNDKKTLKKKYHRAEFWANTLTTSALATVVYAAPTNSASEFGKTLCYTALPITAGITAIKYITYGLYRKSDLISKKNNQKKQADVRSV